MGNSIQNLWPTDLAPTVERTPLTILKEQAAQLGAMTKNLLEGAVKTEMYREDALNQRRFVHNFNVVAPSLEGYSYKLLEVSHELDPYPVTVRLTPPPTSNALADRVTGIPKELASEAEFVEYLRSVFASDKTRRIVGALLAQVQS